MFLNNPEIQKRLQVSTVPNKNKPGVEEPPISAYVKTNMIQPVEIVGSPSGASGLLTWTLAVTATKARLRGSPLAVKGLSVKLRALGATATYVAIGGIDAQEYRLTAAQMSVDLDIDPYNVYVVSDSAVTPVVEVLAIV